MQRISKENQKRTKEYAKDATQENFLSELNDYLHKKESKEYKDIEPKHPFIFVVGAPRSGTTLLTQVLCKGLDSGYIDNISARFWQAPLYGINLSKILLEEKNIELESEFGRTRKLSEPHEFSYFWYEWLKMKKERDFYVPGINKDRIDWKGLKKVLANIQDEFGKPVVMKGYVCARYYEEITKMLGKVIWVYIQRDERDNAVSIYNARMKYYNDANAWWSVMPPEYEEIKDLGFEEQIPAQVYYLNRFYEKMMQRMPDNMIKIRYKGLCDDPQAIVDRISKKMSEMGFSTEVVGQLPKKLKPSSYTKEEHSMFEKGLEKFY